MSLDERTRTVIGLGAVAAVVGLLMLQDPVTLSEPVQARLFDSLTATPFEAIGTRGEVLEVADRNPESEPLIWRSGGCVATDQRNRGLFTRTANNFVCHAYTQTGATPLLLVFRVRNTRLTGNEATDLVPVSLHRSELVRLRQDHGIPLPGGS
jgi:hypothetical protein